MGPYSLVQGVATLNGTLQLGTGVETLNGTVQLGTGCCNIKWYSAAWYRVFKH